MKTHSLASLRKEIQHLNHEELIKLCVELAKFRKENKELATYLLQYNNDETFYITTVKEKIKPLFSQINTSNGYYVKKSILKILRETKKYIKYSNQKETEIILLLFFCEEALQLKPSILKIRTLEYLIERQIIYIKKKLTGLHEDLQYDYSLILSQLINLNELKLPSS